MSRLFRFASITLIFLIILQPAQVFANGGPLYYAASGYGPLQLDSESNVSLVREKVKYTVVATDRTNQNMAEITVEYELLNKNDHLKTVNVLFLTPSGRDLTVKEGKDPIDVMSETGGKPINWEAQVKETVIEPVSGKALPLKDSSMGERQAEGARFALTFEPDETKHILISYVDEGGMYDRGIINRVFSHLYYLTPAAFWEGEPVVELEVKLLGQKIKLHSNLPLDKIDASTYRGTFNHLPEEEWYFSYTTTNRLLYPTNIEKDHNLLILATTAVFTVIAAAASLYFRKSVIFMLTAICIFGFTLYFISKMGGYPFNFIFVGMTDLAVGIVLVVCWNKVKKATRESAVN
ncbi:hypothetical protein AB6A23_06850 [Paenibacillus tarimensis]